MRRRAGGESGRSRGARGRQAQRRKRLRET
jgi:hypothetical protein